MRRPLNSTSTKTQKAEDAAKVFSALITGEIEWISSLYLGCEYAFFYSDVITLEELEEDEEESIFLSRLVGHAAIAMAFLVYQSVNE